MTEDKVKLLDDPILRKRCELVPDSYDVRPLLQRMQLTMLAENGIGLAANQIGVSLRVFILKRQDDIEAFINPEIVSQEQEVLFEGEGCLSIPGVSTVTKRYRNLTLTWKDLDGKIQEKTFEDLEAFAIQHEMDHLNGKLYIDQLGPMKKQIGPFLDGPSLPLGINPLTLP